MIWLPFLPVNTDFFYFFFSLENLAAKSGSGKLCVSCELSTCYLLKIFCCDNYTLEEKEGITDEM